MHVRAQLVKMTLRCTRWSRAKICWSKKYWLKQKNTLLSTYWACSFMVKTLYCALIRTLAKCLRKSPVSGPSPVALINLVVMETQRGIRPASSFRIQVWTWSHVGGRPTAEWSYFHSAATRAEFLRHSRCFQFQINNFF